MVQIIQNGKIDIVWAIQESVAGSRAYSWVQTILVVFQTFFPTIIGAILLYIMY